MNGMRVLSVKSAVSGDRVQCSYVRSCFVSEECC